MSQRSSPSSGYDIPTAISTCVGVGVGTYLFNAVKSPTLKVGAAVVGALVSGALSYQLTSSVEEEGCEESYFEEQDMIRDIRAALINMYRETPCMPIMVRLAWHDAGTYCAADNTGGPNASIRFMPEKSHGANAGLQWAMDKLEPFKAAHPGISYADLYQLASVVAIEFCGGPEIPFRLGREDVAQEKCTPDGRLPDATQGCDHLRDIFHRMGMTDKEIVALSGAHTLGRAHGDRSGFEGAWTQEPLIFDNSYFQELLKKDEDPSLLKLPTDTAMLSDPPMRRFVETYAEDEKRFLEDYAKAHQKLSELGVAFPY